MFVANPQIIKIRMLTFMMAFMRSEKWSNVFDLNIT